MSNKVIIGYNYQAINPYCQIKVLEYVGVYKDRHYYNIQILDDERVLPLTQHQILSGNFKVPAAKKMNEIYQGVNL